MRGFIDTHCHCLPGVDDGPANTAQALDLCRALTDDGVDTVVATPHCFGAFGEPMGPLCLRRAVADLAEALASEGIALEVLAGFEVRLDERILGRLDRIEELTLAGRGLYLLLELPEAIAIDLRPLAEMLRRKGVSILLAHPERYPLLVGRDEVLRQWAEAGIHLQITAAALLGEGYMGPRVRQNAWRLVQSGLPCVVATDAHNSRDRGPGMRRAYAQLAHRLGRHTADRLCCENPRRILEAAALPARRDDRFGAGAG